MHQASFFLGGRASFKLLDIDLKTTFDMPHKLVGWHASRELHIVNKK